MELQVPGFSLVKLQLLKPLAIYGVTQQVKDFFLCLFKSVYILNSDMHIPCMRAPRDLLRCQGRGGEEISGGSGAHRRRGQPQAAGGDMDRHDQHAPAATEWTLSEPRSHGNAIHIKKTHESSN